jgi:HEAT repeat protein
MNIDQLISSATSSGGNDVDVREREHATAALLASPDVARARVLERLAEGSGSEAGLASLLGRLGGATAALSRLLASPVATVRRAAANALAIDRSEEARDVLLRALETGVVEAADALAAVRDPEACVHLAEAAQAADATMRYHALAALAELGCSALEGVRRDALGDPDRDVKDLARELSPDSTEVDAG